MIRLSVLYPKTDGAPFDHEYYRTSHVPLCCTTWGVEAEIDKGVDGPYEAVVHFRFPDMQTLQVAMGADGTAAVVDDVANYTTITPVRQVSEIVQ
jgi:uncharacterized protein (TIGR02118 family)